MGFALPSSPWSSPLGLAWRYLGSYMAAVFDGRVHYLGWAERPVYRVARHRPRAGADLEALRRVDDHLLGRVDRRSTYLIIRIQGSLPLNPQHLGQVQPALSFNTAASFVTNTNWQNYGGETTMSYFSQIGALTVQQFVSPAVGIAVAIALVRGFARRNSSTIGNFWVDITRCLLYILLPIAVRGRHHLRRRGRGADPGRNGHVPRRLNGVTQTIARGPAGFMDSIMQLGTNGGGFLDVDLAHPLENPTALTNCSPSSSSCPSRSP